MFEWTAWKRTRRAALLCFASPLVFTLHGQQDPFPDDRKAKLPNPDEDPRMPDGKSQKNAIAKEQHEHALKDADNLVSVAQQLRDEIKEAGTFVVPLSSVRKTEEIERLAKRIRGRLKG